ncbi:MAG: PAS domain-containing protein [Oceanicaulis sp.]
MFGEIMRGGMGERHDTEKQRRRILEAIAGLQSAVIAGESNARAAFERALELLLDATGSQYGFIGEALKDPDGTPYLQMLAITDIAWDAASREIAALARKSGFAFRNLDTLFGAPMKTGQTLIANNAPNDPRAGGLPPGHPPVHAFLALPLRYGGEMIGLAGLANREGGFDENLVDDLTPLTTALAAMVVAERAKTERDRQSERAELALTGSDAAVWDWDIETGDVWWSPSLKAMLGVPAGFTPDFNHFLSRVHPDDRDHVTGAIDATLERGAPYHHVFRLKRTGAGYATIRSTGHLVRDNSGAPARLIGVQIDISREVALEGRARDAFETHNFVVSAAGLAAMRWEPCEGVIYLNDRFCAMVGRPELAGRPTPAEDVEAMLHPEDRDRVMARLNRTRKGEIFGMEHRILTAAGEVLWVKGHAGRVETSDGAPVVLGVMVDRTAGKRAELELAASKERYDLAVDGSLIAVWDWDAAQDRLYWSNQMFALLGLDQTDFSGRFEAFTSRVHPEDLALIHQAQAAFAATGEPFDLEFRMRHASGRWVTVRGRGAGRLGAGGDIERLSGSILDVTGEREARTAAADATMKIGLAARHAGIGPIEIDLEAGVMRGDESLGRLIGETGRDTISLHHADALVHPDDHDAVQACRRELVEGRTDRFQSEHRIIRPDGSIAWTETVALVTRRDDAGAPLQLSGVVIDHTARREVERDLAEAKLRYDVAISGSYAAIWDQNLLTGEIFWTARLGEILGLGAEARTESLQDFLARTHPDDLEHARVTAREAIETGEPLDNVLRIRRADGVYRHLRSRAAVLFDDRGRAVRLCGSITDITDELEAEAKARLSGRRAELALQAAHLGVWDYEAEAGRVTCDPTLADMLGAPELAGRALTQDQIMAFTHPDDLESVRADLTKLHKGERSSVGNEHRIVRPDGCEVWVRADVGVAERTPDGAVSRLIGIVQDLSGAKLTEELLRKSADHARRASEAKSQFLATMSHEIRTPLNGVLGVVQLLERTTLDPGQRRYVDTIKASGRSLADVIEDVLDISRIEAGHMELKPEPSMIADVLDQAAAASRALASQKGVELSMTVSGDLTEPLLIDPRRVAQMAGNLIGNAVKFTERGGVRVRAKSPERGLLRIEVEDDGPGLPKDMHEAVFERFTQADMSHSRPHQGTGLGLAIVRELAQLAGGVAGVRSKPGEGACFWIELPAPAAKRKAAQAPRSVKRTGSGPLRVLVVEDHPVNRAVTAELVSHSGHVCETADSGEEALAALAVRPVDLVLLDLHMPGLDGAETLARIRRGEAGVRDLPVYMVSADATPEARAKTLALGADGYFVKPLDASALQRTLGDLAERKRMTG